VDAAPFTVLDTSGSSLTAFRVCADGAGRGGCYKMKGFAVTSCGRVSLPGSYPVATRVDEMVAYCDVERHVFCRKQAVHGYIGLDCMKALGMSSYSC